MRSDRIFFCSQAKNMQLRSYFIALCAILVSSGSMARAQNPSPNDPLFYSIKNPYYKYDHDNNKTDFLVKECTWFVWGRCAKAGWIVNTTLGADKFLSTVTNGSGTGMEPRVGAIECSKSESKTGTVYHVAYVTSVENSNKWTIEQFNVIHKSYSTGVVTRNQSDPTALRGGGFSAFTLLGFIYPPNSPAPKPTPEPIKPPAPNNKYTVEISVWPGLPLGSDAMITFYGKDGYYKHEKVGRDNKLTLTDVPGGRGVKVRIDVDLKNKRHHEYYDQEINGSGNRVSLTYKPL